MYVCFDNLGWDCALFFFEYVFRLRLVKEEERAYTSIVFMGR